MIRFVIYKMQSGCTADEKIVKNELDCKRNAGRRVARDLELGLCE